VRIIGIDPGLQATGWGVIAPEGSQLRGVAHGIIRTTTRMNDPERLAQIFEGLQNVITNYQPEIAIIEEIFVKDNPRSALRLGLARGVAILACGQARLALSEISARKVKQAVTGTGTADKKQVADMVSRLLGIPPPPSDAADALALAIACYQGAAAPKTETAQMPDGLSAAIEAACRRDRQKS
tara:strand:- start:292 stop:840 length:549 start_codon:yes stop_codon:yes gene_type:complete